MLLAASSKRSKNWRSLDTTSCDRRGMAASPSGGLALGLSKSLPPAAQPPLCPAARAVYLCARRLPGVELRRLDPACDHLDELAFEAVAERRGACARVIRRAAGLDRPVFVQERVGGAHVAVERDADAARVDELDAVRALAPERQVRVAEDEHALAHAAAEQLGLVGRRLGQEAVDVGDRRAVAGEVRVRDPPVRPDTPR